MNYKIKVSTPEESERCQKALFAMGYVWGGFRDQDIFSFSKIDNGNITTESDGKVIWNDCETEPFEEITLEALEQMAADYMLANLPEMQYSEPSDYNVTTIAESPNEGQRRYEAAIKYLESYGPTIYPHIVVEALKIAAGIS